MMTRRFPGLLLIALLMLACLPVVPGQSVRGSLASDSGMLLRSPWDLRPVTQTDSAYPCAAVATLPRDIDAFSFYSDDKKSRIDPTLYAHYNAVQEPFRALTAQAIDAAEAFRSTGSREAARCVLKMLNVQADAAAMTGRMASNQSYYVQNWTIGALAVTWLKVRTAVPGTTLERAHAIDWMQQVASATQTYFSARHAKGTNDGINNHFHWAGFAVMSAAIAANDRKSFDWGVSTYNEAISRIQADGTLPLEMNRGQRALHYHVFALAPLTSMAEMGAANGLDLYGAGDSALKRLVRVTAEGLSDNTLFVAQARAVQDTPEKSGLKSEDVIWLMPYLSHFPDPALNRLLHSVRLRPFGYLGGYPPG